MTTPTAAHTLPSVTDESLPDAIAHGSGLVAVDFTAEWCAPCRLMKPVLESLALEYDNRLRIVQLDADSNPATLVRLGVRGLPTVLVFRDGVVVDRIVGAMPASRLRERMETLLA